MSLRKTGHLRVLAVCALIISAFSAPALGQQPAKAIEYPGLKPILQYISANWDKLTRSMTSCDSIVDPKIQVAPVLLLPPGFPPPPAGAKLQTDGKVDVEHLPKRITQLGQIDTNAIHPHGLL